MNDLKYKQNLHQHCTYCDGADSPREVIEAAIEKGFDSIGFSGHSYMYYSENHSMSLKGTEEYIKEIHALREEYKDKIDVLCGLEFDMYSEVDLTPYDYIIGSVHYLDIDGQKIGFDRSQDEVERVINTHFGGDGMAYAKAYYEALSRLPEYGSFQILGHPDLIAKHSENKRFFDEDSAEYRKCVTAALEKLAGKIPFFEVNTGAVARGYRTTPYPAPFILDEFKRLGFRAVISSDCHDKRYIDCGFGEAEKLLREHGFTEIYVLLNGEFVPTKI